MSRHPLLFIPSILLLGACPGGMETSDSASEETSITSGGIPFPSTLDTTSDDDAGDTTATPTTSGAEGTAGEPTTEEPPLSCGVADIKADVRIPRVMLVLDKSGSMVSNPAGYWDGDADDADNDGLVDGDPNMTPATPKITRWRSLYSVVEFIVTGFESRMDFGAALFPSKDAVGTYDIGACHVNAAPEVVVDADQGVSILATIPGPDDTEIKGGTPAAAGIMTAIGALARDELLSEEEDLRYIILVTDGAANCNADALTGHDRFEEYDTRFPEMVTAARDAGIPTFVVGIDIQDVASPVKDDGNPDLTNTYKKLNEVAELGGQPRPGAEKFYNSLNQIELQAALEAISQEITSCTFKLNEPLEELQYVRELVVQTDKDLMIEPNSEPLTYMKEQVSDCATESGWHFTDEARSEIELCGAACDAYKVSGKVDIIFDCIDL